MLEGHALLATIETIVIDICVRERLTAREQQVADAVVLGLTNRQIGAQLGIGAETVKRHLASIYGKLGLRSRIALAIHVVRSRAA